MPQALKSYAQLHVCLYFGAIFHFQVTLSVPNPMLRFSCTNGVQSRAKILLCCDHCKALICSVHLTTKAPGFLVYTSSHYFSLVCCRPP